MNSFSEQCLDMARSMLAHNLDSINADGSVTPITGETPRSDEPGHVAFALNAFGMILKSSAPASAGRHD